MFVVLAVVSQPNLGFFVGPTLLEMTSLCCSGIKNEKVEDESQVAIRPAV